MLRIFYFIRLPSLNLLSSLIKKIDFFSNHKTPVRDKVSLFFNKISNNSNKFFTYYFTELRSIPLNLSSFSDSKLRHLHEF